MSAWTNNGKGNPAPLILVLAAAFCFAATSQALNEHLALGNEFFKQLRYTEAMDQLLQALLLEPENPDVRVKIREIGDALKRRETRTSRLTPREHREILQKAWRKLNLYSPEETRREYYLAREAREKGRNLWAWEHYDRLSRMNCEDSRYRSRAEVEMREIVGLVKSKAQGMPFTARNLYLQGFESYSRQDFAGAWNAWNSYLALLGEDQDIFSFLPRVKSKLEIIRAQQQIDGKLADAEQAMKEGRVEQARASIEFVLSLEHDNARALKLLSQSGQQIQLLTRIRTAKELFEKHDYVNTTKTLIEVLQNDPQNVQALTLLDQVERSYSQKMSALLQKESSLRQAQTRQTRLATAPQRPRSASSESQESRAASASSQVYKLVDVARATAHYNRGLIAYAQGKTEEAVQEWRMALQYNPEHEKAMRALERIRAEMRTQTE